MIIAGPKKRNRQYVSFLSTIITLAANMISKALSYILTSGFRDLVRIRRRVGRRIHNNPNLKMGESILSAQAVQ